MAAPDDDPVAAVDDLMAEWTTVVEGPRGTPCCFRYVSATFGGAEARLWYRTVFVMFTKGESR